MTKTRVVRRCRIYNCTSVKNRLNSSTFDHDLPEFSSILVYSDFNLLIVSNAMYPVLELNKTNKRKGEKETSIKGQMSDDTACPQM